MAARRKTTKKVPIDPISEALKILKQQRTTMMKGMDKANKEINRLRSNMDKLHELEHHLANLEYTVNALDHAIDNLE